MNVAIGADHAGLALKTHIVRQVESLTHRVIDVGTHDESPSDYPDFARSVGHAIVSKTADRGILVCGSGVGAAIAANKIRGIRAGVCHDSYSARQAVEHDDFNLLCLGSRIVGTELAADLVRIFLAATFSGEPRHIRRLEKIAQIEHDQW